jgi:hypothetical protein
MGEHRVRAFCSNDANELLAGGAAHAGKAPKRHEERLPSARADSGDTVELRSQIAFASRMAVKRDREPVRLVSSPTDQEKRRTILGQSNGVCAIARKEQFLFFGQPRRHETPQTQLFESRIRSRELSLAAVDQDQIRKRPTGFEEFSVAAQHHLVHRGEIVIY